MKFYFTNLVNQMHDTTASSDIETGDEAEEIDGSDIEGEDADDAALEEEVKQYLKENDDSDGANLGDTGDEDWGSGSPQTETSTADDDEATEGHNYDKVW